MQRTKQVLVAIWLILVVAFLSSGSAAGFLEEKTAKEMYKEDCRVCHTEDSPNGDYTPMSLTQDQWKEFFKNKLKDTHKDVVLEREKKKLLEYLTPEKIKELEKFCVKHAADSEQPQTCS